MNKELLVKLVFHARCPTSGFEQQGLRVLVHFGDVDSLSQAHIDIPFKICNKKLVVIIHNSILSSTCRQYSMYFVQWFSKSYFLCQKKKKVFSRIQMYLLCWGYHFLFSIRFPMESQSIFTIIAIYYDPLDFPKNPLLYLWKFTFFPHPFEFILNFYSNPLDIPLIFSTWEFNTKFFLYKNKTCSIFCIA